MSAGLGALWLLGWGIAMGAWASSNGTESIFGQLLRATALILLSVGAVFAAVWARKIAAVWYVTASPPRVGPGSRPTTITLCPEYKLFALDSIVVIGLVWGTSIEASWQGTRGGILAAVVILSLIVGRVIGNNFQRSRLTRYLGTALFSTGWALAVGTWVHVLGFKSDAVRGSALAALAASWLAHWCAWIWARRLNGTAAAYVRTPFPQRSWRRVLFLIVAGTAVTVGGIGWGSPTFAVLRW